MKIYKIITFFIFLMLMAGCTKDQVYRSFYEGMMTHEDLKNTPGDPLEKHKSYDLYEQEREEVLNK